MSSPWGPAFDAEIAYRQQQARNDYRPWSWRRKPAKVRDEALAQRLPAQRQSTQPLTAQRIPAQPGPVQLNPSRPQAIDQITVAPQQTQSAEPGVDRKQSTVHAA